MIASGSTGDHLEFPPELCAKPTALVGLGGLDVTNKQLHRTIWESFNKCNDRSKVNFKVLSGSYNFPLVKPKKLSYDKYIPKGLLKKNWMKKHAQLIPAVIAFLFELNWDDPNWEEKKQECTTQFQILRASLGGHGTKLAIILVQHTPPLPAAEDVKATDKAKALCFACELELKQLFVLPHNDHMPGYVLRLENAMYELSQTYYQHEIKLIRQHKDALNKYTHQYLLVRHQFKMGFLSELKHDQASAMKYYESAYAAVREVRMSDTNMLEVKLVAGFINYKLCQLMFVLNKPRDAIGQLRTHIDFFRDRVGTEDLLFEHYSWISKQFSAFGDIFDDAIRHGLTAVQTQHPGFYYRQAAQSAIDRKRACWKLCKDVITYPEVDPLAAQKTLDFFGQRPWRPGKLSAEPANPAMESSGVQALKFKERSFNHSVVIISLLGSAISQFKTYKCPRMRLELVVQMAEEYHLSQDYGKALTLLSHMLWDYRNEKWWQLLSKLISRALSCAYLSGSVQDYLIFALEALGPSAKLKSQEKQRIFNNLMSVLKLKTPEPEPDVPAGAVPNAQVLWTTANNNPPLSVPLEVTSATSCIEAKARFTQKEFLLSDLITVEVYVRCSCPAPIEFSHLSVVVSSPNYSSQFAVTSTETSLWFEPGVMKRLLCEFHCNPADAGKEIQIGFILLTLGSASQRSVALKFSGSDPSNNKLKEFHRLKTATNDMDSIECLGVAKVLSEPSKVELTCRHECPALLAEWYPIHIDVTNQEECPLLQPTLDVGMHSSGEDAGNDQSTQLWDKDHGGPASSSLTVTLDQLDPSKSSSVTVYLRGHRIGERSLAVKLTYMVMRSETEQSCSVDQIVKVPVVKPFEVSTQVLSMKFEQLVKCFAHDAFVLSPSLQITSPWPLLIHNSTLELGLLVKSCDQHVTSHLAGTELSKGETGTDMFALHIDEPSDHPVALGSYVVQWARAGSTEVTSSSVTMPTVMCAPSVVSVEMSLPAHGWVRRPMAVEYSLRNLTETLLELELTIDVSDAFMFAGQKKVLLRLLPDTTRTLEYNFYPLFSGLVALPHPILVAPDFKDYNEQLVQIIERNLPSHIYVMPQEKPNQSAISV